jgi:hypothetical protein
MAVEDWNWRYPVELQDVPWDCSAASLCWALNAYGFGITEAEVVEGLGPSRISPALGLLDASGSGLVAYLGELGIPAMNDPSCSWAEILGAAGFQPMVMGGRAWCHWTGVRIGDKAWAGHEVKGSPVLLANPAPGYLGVFQAMTQAQFDSLGPFSAVWFPA